jgi:PAS domain S-box-containing protein
MSDNIDELRHRLDEAEDMRRAITEGEVDAFVVGNDHNRRVLLLANAYQRYRQLVERMQQGAVTVTPQGLILYANQRLADMLGLELRELYAAPLDAHVAVGDRARLSSFLLVSSRDSRVELDLVHRHGTPMRVRLSLATLTEGYATVLVSDLRPLEWPAMVVEALGSIGNSVETLRGSTSVDAQHREMLDSISEQLRGLASLIDEIRAVHGISERNDSA